MSAFTPHPRERESDVLRTILDYLKVHRVFHFRCNTGSAQYVRNGKTQFVRFGSVGAADIIAVYRGCCIGIEAKSSYGSQSESQVAFGTELRKAGGIYVVARSLEDVDAVLRYVEGRGAWV